MWGSLAHRGRSAIPQLYAHDIRSECNNLLWNHNMFLVLSGHKHLVARQRQVLPRAALTCASTSPRSMTSLALSTDSDIAQELSSFSLYSFSLVLVSTPLCYVVHDWLAGACFNVPYASLFETCRQNGLSFDMVVCTNKERGRESK